MEYMSITQAAEKWGITQRRIQVLCKEERIPGAIRIGYVPRRRRETKGRKGAKREVYEGSSTKGESTS